MLKRPPESTIQLMLAAASLEKCKESGFNIARRLADASSKAPLAADPSAEAEPKTKKRKKGKRKSDTSRILVNEASAAAASKFIEALRKGDRTGDFTEFVSLLRGMSPIAVDQELQGMQVKIPSFQDTSAIFSPSTKLVIVKRRGLEKLEAHLRNSVQAF